MSEKRPILSVAVFVKNLNYEYLISSKNKAGIEHEIWSLPGGDVHFGESPLEAVRRWVMKEAGCKTKYEGPMTSNPIISHIYPNGNHHIIIMYTADVILIDEFEGIKEIREDGQEYQVRWCRRKDFPENLMEPLPNFMKRVRASQELL